MLFNKLFTISAITTLAAATALPRGGGGGGSGGAGTYCCSQVQSASQAGADKNTLALLGLIGVAVGDITALVGLNCSPITVVGGGNGGCNTNAVNCQSSSLGGLINLGCVPIQA